MGARSFSTQALELPPPTHKTIRHHYNLQVTTQNSPVQTRTQRLTDHCLHCLFVLSFCFFSTMSCFLTIYDDFMLCKVTLGALKGASKLNVLLLLLLLLLLFCLIPVHRRLAFSHLREADFRGNSSHTTIIPQRGNMFAGKLTCLTFPGPQRRQD